MHTSWKHYIHFNTNNVWFRLVTKSSSISLPSGKTFKSILLITTKTIENGVGELVGRIIILRMHRHELNQQFSLIHFKNPSLCLVYNSYIYVFFTRSNGFSFSFVLLVWLACLHSSLSSSLDRIFFLRLGIYTKSTSFRLYATSHSNLTITTASRNASSKWSCSDLNDWEQYCTIT